MKKREYVAGDMIIQEGAPSDYVFEISSGEVEVLKELEGQTVTLGVMKTGDFFGEMGVLDGQLRSASVRAKTNVSTIVLDKEDFLRIISEDSSLSYLLLTRLCERMRTLTRTVAEAKVSKTPGKTIEEKTPIVPVADIPDEDRARVQLDEVNVTLLPLSEQLISSLPKEGITIDNLPFSVGRSPLPKESKSTDSIDLAIEDTRPFRMSRMHFALYQHSEGLVVLDLGSTLGTEVNGEFLGYHSNKDFSFLKLGKNEITAGGAGSPFAFQVMMEPK